MRTLRIADSSREAGYPVRGGGVTIIAWARAARRPRQWSKNARDKNTSPIGAAKAPSDRALRLDDDDWLGTAAGAMTWNSGESVPMSRWRRLFHSGSLVSRSSTDTPRSRA